jgi:mercuric ion transport protein
MKHIDLIVTAVFTAVLSTSCCLPAFLYLFFGISVGSLSFLQEFGFLRIPLALLSIILLVLYYKKSKQSIFCEKTKKIDIKKYIVFPMLIMILLLYPEFSVYFVE